MPERNISTCNHKLIKTNCKKCGIYQHPQDPAIKTDQYDTVLNCSAAKYIKHLRQRQCPQLDSREISEQTFALLEAICEKFQYGIETLALGLFVFAKSCEKQAKNEKFWSSASLMVASKAIQLDKRVPYLNRFQRYADKSFTQEDYELAERSIFEEMKFDLQFSTFVSFLNFYLANGVVFQSDGLPPAAVKHVQDQIMYKAKQAIRNASFTSHQPEKFALSIIKDTRTKYRLQPWKKQLEVISGFSAHEIISIEPTNILKPLIVLNNGTYKMKERHPLSMSVNQNSTNGVSQDSTNVLSQNSTNVSNQNSTNGLSQNSTMNSSQNGQQLMDAKGKFYRKKMENTLKLQSVKENTMKGIQAGGLNSFRNSTFSSSKYPHNISLSSSTDRIIPLNSFLNRRA